MKLGIMQPYFIPYLGYWQLINAVDKYVVYDDVNYIKGGWINRNRILIHNETKYFNVPLLGASPNKLINEVEVNNQRACIDKNLRLLQNVYSHAPYFGEIYPMMEKILTSGKTTVSLYILESLKIICEYLGIETELILSSELKKNTELRGQEKVLHICEILGATEYYNAIDGQQLYSKEVFAERGISLRFLQMNDIKYKQFTEEFHPNLSIVDVMMFSAKEDIRKMLNQYELY